MRLSIIKYTNELQIMTKTKKVRTKTT